MITKTLILALLLIAPSAFADEAADIKAFNEAFAKYSKLTQKAKDLDAAIEAAETVYKLAPRIYGKKSEEYAIVTYNLAGLYDERSGEGVHEDESRASDLYEKYFRMQKAREVKKDQDYLTQYIPYVLSYYQSHQGHSKSSIAKEMLDIAYSINLSNLELADIEYYAASLIADHIRLDYAVEIYESSLDRYLKEPEIDQLKIGELNLILAKHYLFEKNVPEALEMLIAAAETFESSDQDTEKLRQFVYEQLAMTYANIGEMEEAEKYNNLYKALLPLPTANRDVPLPIRRSAPNYPASAAKRSQDGWVLVSFTIDKTGNTKNVIATKYSDKVFVNAAVKAANRYLYAVPEVDGINQEIHGVEVRIEFMIAR